MKSSILIGLKRCNDIDLVYCDNVYKEIGFTSNQKSDVILIVSKLNSLIDSYNYLESPEFLHSLINKSESYKNMKIKLFTPEKRKMEMKRFYTALENQGWVEIYSKLLPEYKHKELMELIELFEKINQ